MCSLRLGELLLRQDRVLEATPVFEHAMSGPSRWLPAAHLGLGQIALTQGHVQGAIRHLKEEVRYDPYHQEALE